MQGSHLNGLLSFGSGTQRIGVLTEYVVSAQAILVLDRQLLHNSSH